MAQIDQSPRYRLFRRVMRIIGKVLFGFTVHGAENVPAKGSLIVAANHSQYADPVLVCMAIPRRTQWMAKKELFGFPFRPFFEFIGSFPVDRAGGGRAGLRLALSFLADGWALGIFPEGTHKGNGGSRDAKSGAVVLAVRSGAPVLPVFVGAAPGPLARLRGEKLHVYVGAPRKLDPALRGGRAYREEAEVLLREIYALPDRDGKGNGR